MRSTAKRVWGLLVLSAALGAIVGWQRAPGDNGPAYRGIERMQVRFASVEEGRAALGADDEWIALTSDLQRAALMGTAPPASREAFRAWQAANVLPWTDHDRQRWQTGLAALAPKLNTLQLPLPAEILLVRTSGRESAHIPHTRGHTIVLPTGFHPPGFSDVEVLAHEIFHVVSRDAPALATRLYALIGFEPAAELEWPADWLPLRIADADAPQHRHLMRLTHAGEAFAVMPLVVASHSPLEPDEPITSVMETRLLRVTPGRNGEPTRAVLRDGRPLWHSSEDLPEFERRIGPNTDYTIHPEEAMADNFMFVVSGRPVADAALLQRIEAALRQRY